MNTEQIEFWVGGCTCVMYGGKDLTDLTQPGFGLCGTNIVPKSDGASA